MTPALVAGAGSRAALRSSNKLGHRQALVAGRAQGRRTYSLASRYGVKVSAVAAPEKASNSSEPFTAWGTAKQRVQKREDIK